MNLGEPTLIDEVRTAATGDVPTTPSDGEAWGWIGLLGFGHFAVELGCSYALNRMLDATELGAGAVLAYNAVAFWGQVPLGWASDSWNGARALALFGVALLVAGLITLGVDAPWLVVALIALGNGCYHIGGGVLAIERSAGRLGGLGLFVGPGAVGLTLGVGLARMDFPAAPWALGALAALLAWPLWRMGGEFSRRNFCVDDMGGIDGADSRLRGRAVSPKPPRRLSAACAGQAADVSGKHPYHRIRTVVALVLACIAIRAFVGTGFSFAWGGSAVAALALGAALAGGKIVGGFLADRFGWLHSTVAVLALSVPALWFGQTSMPMGLAGVALFQAPMAVTLGALVWALPRRPGLAFGLASAAVYAGGFPLLVGQEPWLHTFVGLSCLSLAAVVMLAVALRGERKRCKV